MNNLADAVRAVPQNFGGSQNPGAGLNVPENNGTRLGAGSSINLRGLGGDATLTLLNGHRLTYNSFKQAIDISTIPLAAVRQIEIVADGASALYGSDAVAGVANIELKRDFSGLNTSARFGAATDGGDEQQEYSVVGGGKWRSGGFIAAYDFQHASPIVARERSYTASTSPGLTLYPNMTSHSVVVSGHQRLVGRLDFDIDAVFNTRSSSYSYALTTAGLPERDGAFNFAKSTSFTIAPSLKLALSDMWELMLVGTYGEDRTLYGSDTFSSGTVISPTRGCYCNTSKSVEINGDGRLFALPGGDAKVALGGGYRTNDFHGYRTQGTAQNIQVSQAAYFAFGEVSLPLVAPRQDVPLVSSLNLSGAIRFEDYPDIARVVTPKLGLVYAPTPDFDIKASWGKSFRAPTLYQRYAASSAALIGAASRGGIGYPSTATVLQLTGGNPDLKPERATTWTVTVAAHPRFLEGARFEVSYFDIKYKDRIVAPVVLAQALSNPVYADFITLNPTASLQSTVIAGATNFVNGLGRPYNPSEVVALVNNANVNAARQTIHGIDVLAEYKHGLGNYGTIRVMANGSYLTSAQRLGSLQADIPLAGRVFNPPHFRGRGGIDWEQEALSLTAYVNRSGGVEDARAATTFQVGGMTTVDLAVRYKVSAGPSMFRNITFTLSVQNAFNAKPSLLKTTQVYEAPYDSTNYSPVGRFISFGVAKQW